MGAVMFCVAAVHSLTRSFPSTATSHPVHPNRQRHTHPLLSEGGETDWEEAMRALRARSDTGAGDAGGGDAGAGDAGVGDSGGSEPGPSPLRFESSLIEEPTAGFRFERPGAERPDEQEQLVRLATVYGGRLLTAITLSSLVFYIYVGLSVCCHLRTSMQSSFVLISHLPAPCDSDMCCGCGWQGGITDGFDRFTEPIEDIRVTMEREANM